MKTHAEAAAVKVLRRKKERQDETQFITKIDGFQGAQEEKRKDRMKLSLSPKLMVFKGAQEEKKERQDETQFITKIDGC